MTLADQLGRAIVEQRERSGKSRRAAALELGVAGNTLRELELGLANPTLARVETLADAFELDVELRIRPRRKTARR